MILYGKERGRVKDEKMVNSVLWIDCSPYALNCSSIIREWRRPIADGDYMVEKLLSRATPAEPHGM